MSDNGYVRGRRAPARRHVFRLADGETLIVPHADARRTLDKRGGAYTRPQVCWEVTLATGVVRRLWPEDVVSWDVEELAS